MHVAALYGNTAVIEALLAHSDVGEAELLETRSRAGRSPLELALMRGRREAACLLWRRTRQIQPHVHVPAEQQWTLEDCDEASEKTRLPPPPSPPPPSPPPPPPLPLPPASPVSEAWGNGVLSPALAAAAEQPCGEARSSLIVVRESGLSPSVFLSEFYMPGRPLLLKRAALRWPMRTAWSKAALLGEHGRLRVSPAAVPYASAFGLRHAERSLRSFVNALFAATASGGTRQNTSEAQQTAHGGSSRGSGLEETPLYLFARAETDTSSGAGTVPSDGVGVLLKSARLPRMPAQLATADAPYQPQPAQFYLGAAGTGAPLHFHGDAYNVLAHGRKRWWLFAPDAGNYSVTPAHTWVQREMSDLCRRCERGGVHAWQCPLTFTQEAGDLLFVPRDWAHATLNLAPSVGYATEFDSPHSRAST
jgi:hypothetical protein